MTAMSVTGNFFSKLRSLAVTLEKETGQLEQLFSSEDNEYEEESPMRVLHDLRSDIMVLKGDFQSTLNKRLARGQELSAFIKACRVLHERTAADIEQIKETFQTYGYKPQCNANSEREQTQESGKPKENGVSPNKADVEDLQALPTLEKTASTSWDILRAPQLSDFGLAHYQLPTAWEPPKVKPCKKDPEEEKPRIMLKDPEPMNVAKTPKCALRLEEDFSQIQHFGISDCSTNLNDDYTMALINKKFQKNQNVTENAAKETCQPKNLKSLLATPSHLSHRMDWVDSPLPPVFCTPGLKVHKKEKMSLPGKPAEKKGLNANNTTLPSDTCDRNDPDSAHLEDDYECTAVKPAIDFKSTSAAPAYLSLGSNINSVYSPRPPVFCTPGLKVHKKETSSVLADPTEPKGTGCTDTPPLPSFQTNWLKSDAKEKGLDITEPVPRPDLSYRQCLEEPPTLVLNSNKYEAPAMRDYCMGTPPRPEMTVSLTEDLFKYNVKPSSPPKVSEYENMLWTPVRPEMTSCITEDISQILSKYCDNNMNPADGIWDKAGAPFGKISTEYENKENRLY
ncbi:hypothetical protein XENTR_v10007012 [Xenopus tropicalis]|nr:spindle and kinetochore-associated protein 3 [Xenopus tropicalis]XP_012811876.1 spindle and kinetochore-associated protein 3 isoform X1 [Xenopus tropicalis]XP_012811877.1 spindle and kinetochore-associated protein 3 isoform X1 [Xenopus tropicalis]XP_012811878.1 spindle and kinetochore-associated protein 3 isoform X1 [Xenopus tropicalis]XP_012811880.1 spindle and kinetochore-associated protein 3 isoform X1 [Xenopus tropicalis]AAI58249.1 LOC100144945 protein [Xenopus tropicalis]KAE8627463.1 |eukprot:XP_017946565.1 PREDICTED: spindle and kinetochore-associated protein 3 isoform X1 [Xenopus tropicalis]